MSTPALCDVQATNYLSTITVQSGKVFAFFAKSPTKLWSADAKMMRDIQNSFRTIPRSYARSGPGMHITAVPDTLAGRIPLADVWLLHNL